MTILKDLLGFYNNKDLDLGADLRLELVIMDNNQEITEDNIKAFFRKRYNSFTPSTLEHGLLVAKIYSLIHNDSPKTYKLSHDIILNITMDLKKLLEKKSIEIKKKYPHDDFPECLITGNTKEDHKHLFKYLELADIISKDELNAFYQKKIVRPYKDRDSKLKITDVGLGNRPETSEELLKKGIQSIGNALEGSMRNAAYSGNKNLPHDRPLAEKDYIIDPNSNTYEKMLPDVIREQLKNKIGLLDKMHPKPDSNGDVKFTGEQLFKKFNVIVRNLCLDYRNNINRDKFDANIKLTIYKLAVVLRQNDRLDDADNLLASVDMDKKFKLTKGFSNVFKRVKNNEPSLFSPAVIAEKINNLMGDMKSKLGSRELLLHGSNDKLPENIASHVNKNKDVINMVNNSLNVLEANPDASEPRRRFFNRLVKLRAALNNYEMVDAGIQAVGDDTIGKEVLSVDFLFEQFKQQYDKFIDRADANVNNGADAHKKYIEIGKIEKERGNEIREIQQDVNSLSGKITRRIDNNNSLIEQINNKSVSMQDDEVDKIHDKKNLLDKIQEKIQRLNSEINKGTGAGVQKAKSILAVCSELFAQLPSDSHLSPVRRL